MMEGMISGSACLLLPLLVGFTLAGTRASVLRNDTTINCYRFTFQIVVSETVYDTLTYTKSLEITTTVY